MKMWYILEQIVIHRRGLLEGTGSCDYGSWQVQNLKDQSPDLSLKARNCCMLVTDNVPVQVHWQEVAVGLGKANLPACIPSEERADFQFEGSQAEKFSPTQGRSFFCYFQTYCWLDEDHSQHREQHALLSPPVRMLIFSRTTTKTQPKAMFW